MLIILANTENILEMSNLQMRKLCLTELSGYSLAGFFLIFN